MNATFYGDIFIGLPSYLPHKQLTLVNYVYTAWQSEKYKASKYAGFLVEYDM